MNTTILRLSVNGLISNSPLLSPQTNTFIKNSKFNRFTSNILYQNNFLKNLHVLSSKFSNGLSSAIRVSSEDLKDRIIYDRIEIENDNENVIERCHFYKIKSPDHSALEIKIQPIEFNISKCTFFECASTKAPGALDLQSRTTFNIDTICVLNCQTSALEIPIVLIKEGRSTNIDGISIIGSMCNGSIFRLEADDPSAKNLNISKCSSALGLYLPSKKESISYAIFTQNTAHDYFVMALYTFSLTNSVFIETAADKMIKFKGEDLQMEKCYFTKLKYSTFLEYDQSNYKPRINNCEFDFSSSVLEGFDPTNCKFDVKEFSYPVINASVCYIIPLPTQSPTPSEMPPIIIGRNVFETGYTAIVVLVLILIVSIGGFILYRRLTRHTVTPQDDNYLAEDEGITDELIDAPE